MKDIEPLLLIGLIIGRYAPTVEPILNYAIKPWTIFDQLEDHHGEGTRSERLAQHESGVITKVRFHDGQSAGVFLS